MGEGRWYKYGLHAIILGSWVFWVYSWNTRICIWAFENYNLAILKNHSILTSQLFSPYASSAQSLQQSWEAAHLCICSLPSPEKGHVWLKAECPPRPSTAIPGRKGSCCACLVTGLDRREPGSAHGRSRKANAKLGWRGKGNVDLDSSSQRNGRSKDETLGWTPPYFFPPLLANPNLGILFYLESEHLPVTEK